MAVHVLTFLASKEGDRVTSADLAGSVNTHPVIVRRLLLALQRAKRVDTYKGAGAGSRLNHAPRHISLAEVYRAVEVGEAFAMPVRKPDTNCPVGHGILQAPKPVFVSAQSALEQDLEKTTLADVLDTLKRPPPSVRARNGKRAV